MSPLQHFPEIIFQMTGDMSSSSEVALLGSYYEGEWRYALQQLQGEIAIQSDSSRMSQGFKDEFPWLVGSYCSYLLPKQALSTFSSNCNKIL